MSGYPYFDNGQQIRDPYESRALRDMMRRDRRDGRGDDEIGDRRPRREDPFGPPMLTLRAPREEQGRRRGSRDESRSPFDMILPNTPPPPLRPHASRRTVDRFGDRFRELPAPSK